MAAREHPRRDARPRAERPRLVPRRVGLTGLAAGERLGDDLRGDVVEERRHHVEVGVRITPFCLVLLPLRPSLTGVHPPRAGRLARRRDHRRHEDQQPHIDPVAQHGGRERGHRLRHDDQLVAIADRVDGRVRVLAEPGRVVAGRQVRGDDFMALGAQPRGDQVPVPRVSAGAGQEHVRRRCDRAHADKTPASGTTHRCGAQDRCEGLTQGSLSARGRRRHHRPMSTHLSQYVAACRLEDDLRAAAAARTLPRRVPRKPPAVRFSLLRGFHRPAGSGRFRHVG